jgi:hypothetical protein
MAVRADLIFRMVELMDRNRGPAMSGYDSLLGRRESEASVADVFEAEFPIVMGRSVKIIERGESPDYVAMIDDIETGLELTAIHAGDAETILDEINRISAKKGTSYRLRNLFARPIILLGDLDWPAPDTEGTSLFECHSDLTELIDANKFDSYGFSEVWLMDAGYKFSSRSDSRSPADFFCFAPANYFGFHQRERKRRPYWGLIRDRFL